MIELLQRREIDDERWDRLIAASLNETIYPYSWYMDSCADNWLALVMNDYEFVMPVAFRSKLGLRYIYQPVYCQQLGVFSEKKADREINSMFLDSLKKNFKIGDYSFNEGNVLDEKQGCKLSDSINYVLPLSNSYEAIRGAYSQNCRRNINKAARFKLDFSDQVTVDEVISLKRMSEAVIRNDTHYLYVNKLFTSLEGLGKIKIFGVRSEGQLLSAAIFAISKSRIIFLLSASSDAGKERSAMFHVVDSLIQMYAGKKIKLDFEGSNIASIARFFSGFGARPNIYKRVSFQNTTAKIIKKLKGV